MTCQIFDGVLSFQKDAFSGEIQKLREASDNLKRQNGELLKEKAQMEQQIGEATHLINAFEEDRLKQVPGD